MKTKSFIARRAFIGRLRPFISRAAAFIARRATCLVRAGFKPAPYCLVRAGLKPAPYCLVRAGLKPAPYYCLLALLLLLPLAAFAQEPNMTLCESKGYTIRSAPGKEAAGIGDSPLTFTWYESADGGANYTVMSGFNTETIYIQGGRPAGTYMYTRNVASAECLEGVHTKPYTVLVHPLPQVDRTSDPALCGSGSHTLEVTAEVSGSSEGVSVAWYTNSDLSGSTVSNTTSYTVSDSTVVGTTYTYYVQAIATDSKCKAAATVSATRVLTEGEIAGPVPPPPYAASTQTWTFGDSPLVWSDRINYTDCPKEKPNNWYTDPHCSCYSGTSGTYCLYGWACAVLFQDIMCPSPWRLPVKADFEALLSVAGEDEVYSAWPKVINYDQDAYYWSTTKWDNYDNFAWALLSDTTRLLYYGIETQMSVRCVK